MFDELVGCSLLATDVCRETCLICGDWMFADCFDVVELLLFVVVVDDAGGVVVVVEFWETIVEYWRTGWVDDDG